MTIALKREGSVWDQYVLGHPYFPTRTPDLTLLLGASKVVTLIRLTMHLSPRLHFFDLAQDAIA